MKKLLALLLIIFLLSACSEPFEPKLSGALAGLSYTTDEVISQINEKGVIGLEDSSILSTLTAKDGYNITSTSIRASTGAEIYKFASNNMTVLALNNSFYLLGEADGGYGVISILEHDLDGDGISELYFTYCTGEENKGRVGCFSQASASVLTCETKFDTPLLAVVTKNGGIDLYAATVDYGKFSSNNINSQVDAAEKAASLTLTDNKLTVK